MFPLISVFRLTSRGQPGFRLPEAGVSFPAFRALLEQRNEETYHLPIAIEEDTLRSLPDEPLQPCLLIYNREHPMDYFRHCILLERQDEAWVLDMKYGGRSDGQKARTAADRAGEYRYYEALGALFAGCCREIRG